MNKKKIIRVSLISLAALLLLFTGSAFIQYRAQFKSMTPVETGLIRKDLLSLKTDFVNSYLLETAPGEYIAFDAGLSVEETEEQLVKLNVTPDQIKAVFLTHSDYDHAGGAEIYKEAKVYLPKKEVAMIDGTVNRALLMKNSLTIPYVTIKDGEAVMVDGISVQNITAEGHTAGSSAYLVDQRYLFTGDLLKVKENKGEVFIPTFNIDTEALKRSLKKLAAYDKVELVLTGHFGISDNPGELLKGIE